MKQDSGWGNKIRRLIRIIKKATIHPSRCFFIIIPYFPLVFFNTILEQKMRKWNKKTQKISVILILQKKVAMYKRNVMKK